MDGRKIVEDHECPIDNFSIELCRKMFPIFKRFNFTPNTLTFISLLFGLGAIYKLLYNDFASSGILLFIGYIFDCCDGNYARTYDMVTDFGDLFDHITDILVYGVILVILYYKKLYKLLFFVILILMMCVPQMMFQECLHDNPTLGMSHLSKLNEYFGLTREECLRGIEKSRMFGVGTSNLIVMMTLIIYHFYK